MIVRGNNLNTEKKFNVYVTRILKTLKGANNGVPGWLETALLADSGYTLNQETLALLYKVLEFTPATSNLHIAFPKDGSSLPVVEPVKAKKEPVQKRQNDVDVAEKYARKFRDALKRGIEFDLSFTGLKNLMREKTCYYTGVELTNSLNDDGSVPENYWTIDRIDSKKGYVRGNVVACSDVVNRWKNIVIEQSKFNLSIEQMVAVMQKTVRS